ncbi:ATP-binding protein [Streptomyces sp. SHP 1-2]|uniref:ATP-binding protein n=1 Tax=Streptomyces sp. SHP 1-2 TaxID=2769489 RepID=UPI0022370E9B|nr:ATP-binding protein [Streptomyces sp. SHP 1-2]MCW5250197.1 ATP-binding protein [Streptomyces sp. SHP 1-2]
MEPTDGITTAAPGTAPGAGPRGARAAGAVTSAAAARAYVESVVRAEWDGHRGGASAEDVIDLLLVVSELVTNAIRHGGGLAGFEARATADGVWVAVHDHSAAEPRAARAFPTEHRGSGYGWPLVVRLAREVAVVPRPAGGKTISVLVPVRSAGPGAGKS